MLDTYHYFVINREPEPEKFLSSVLRVYDSRNLLSILAGYKDLRTVNTCKTKKEAEAIRDDWNDCYKKNGTYALSKTDKNEFIPVFY